MLSALVGKSHADARTIVEQMDNDTLRMRDSCGNSLLHQAVLANASSGLFHLLLQNSQLHVKNENGRQVDELLLEGSSKEQIDQAEVYFTIMKIYIKEILTEGDSGHQLDSWILHGWNFTHLLDPALTELKEEINEDFDAIRSKLMNLSNTIRQLHRACLFGTLEEVTALLEAATTSRSTFTAVDLLQSLDPFGFGIAHKWVVHGGGNMDMWKHLLELDPTLLHSVDKMERTALHYAAAITSPLCPTLLQMGADPTKKDLKQLTPMDYNKETEGGNCSSSIALDDIHRAIAELSRVGQRFLPSPSPSSALVCGSNVVDHLIPGQHSRADSTYLRDVISQPLVRALASVIERRPADPILCLSEALRTLHSQPLPSPATSSLTFPNCSQPPEVPPTSGRRKFTFPPELFLATHMVPRNFQGNTRLHQFVLRSTNPASAAPAEETDSSLFDFVVHHQVNFALKNVHGKTARQLAKDLGQWQWVHELDDCILNIIAEDNVLALEYLVVAGYASDLPNLYEVFGPDLFDVPPNVAAFYQQVMPRFCEFIEETFIGILNDTEVDLLTAMSHTLNSGHSLALALHSDGVPLLMHCILENRSQLVHYLLQHFPETICLTDPLNRLPLHYAYAKGAHMLDVLGRCCGDNSGKDNNKVMEGESVQDCLGHLPIYYARHCEAIYLLPWQQ